MNKENNKNAAGLRRSAMAERIRLREEWSALKGPCNDPERQTNVLAKKPQNITNNKNNCRSNVYNMRQKDVTELQINEILRGTVVLVDVGAETRALALRAALMALGASVMAAWSPLVTHVVWSQGGCTKIRAKARALACRLVSPIWVESCAASGRRLPEKMFPAVSRPSDLPSPCTLKKMLKKMYQENIPLNLLTESQEGEKRPRLRISSETENDTTNTTHDTSQDTSQDISHDESHDKSKDSDVDVSRNVNTGPRRLLPISTTTKPKKSKRKLFTHKEAEITNSGDESDKETAPKQKTVKNITRDGRRELIQAERMARKMLGAPKGKTADKNNKAPRIVLTGMSKEERHDIFNAIHKLNGVVQSHVNKRTTHVLLGTSIESRTTVTQRTPLNRNPTIMCQKCNSPEKILTEMFENHVNVTNSPKIGKNNGNLICNCDISGVNVLNEESDASLNIFTPKKKNLNIKKSILNKNDDLHIDLNRVQNTEVDQRIDNSQSIIVNNNQNGEINESQNIDITQNNQNFETIEVLNRHDKPRTVNALLGAVRGCRVLFSRWAIDSVKHNRWLHHFGYEVPHLLKISQKARIERLALNKMSSEYAYDVFNGMKVNISENAEQKDAVKQLLNLCGAVTELPKQNGGQVTRNGGVQRQYGGLTLGKRGKKKEPNTTKTQSTQNGGPQQDGAPTFDITIGREIGEISSKWLFDSIAAARMRTTRRYVKK